MTDFNNLLLTISTTDLSLLGIYNYKITVIESISGHSNSDVAF